MIYECVPVHRMFGRLVSHAEQIEGTFPTTGRPSNLSIFEQFGFQTLIV